MHYFEIQRIIWNYNDYIYILYTYIYMNYFEIQRIINNYNDYIYIYIHKLIEIQRTLNNYKNYIYIYIYIYTCTVSKYHE